MVNLLAAAATEEVGLPARKYVLLWLLLLPIPLARAGALNGGPMQAQVASSLTATSVLPSATILRLLLQFAASVPSVVAPDDALVFHELLLLRRQRAAVSRSMVVAAASIRGVLRGVLCA